MGGNEVCVCGGGGGGGLPALAGIREYRQSDHGRKQAEGVNVILNLECPVGLSPKEYVHISMKEIERNLDGPLKGLKKGSYVMF